MAEAHPDATPQDLAETERRRVAWRKAHPGPTPQEAAREAVRRMKQIRQAVDKLPDIGLIRPDEAEMLRDDARETLAVLTLLAGLGQP